MQTAVRGFAALAAAALFMVLVTGTAGARQGSDAQGSAVKGVSDAYIVILEEAPAAAYTGGISGYAATKPAAGQKLNKNSANVQKYVGYLTSRHNAVAGSVGAAKLYD